jgi:hypothetical protein
LAFFALACQFVLAFGHVHLGKVGGSDAWAVAADSGNRSADVPNSPHKNPTGLVDDFCAICASISLASTLVIPTSPAVVPPISIVRICRGHWQRLSPPHLTTFDARGPPHA